MQVQISAYLVQSLGVYVYMCVCASATHERRAESSGVQATKSLMNGNMCSLIDQFSD